VRERITRTGKKLRSEDLVNLWSSLDVITAMNCRKIRSSARTRGMRSVGSVQTAERSLPELKGAHLRHRLIWEDKKFIK
jgi:hypothetical protein